MRYYGRLFGEQRGQRTKYWDTGRTGKEWHDLEIQRDALREALEPFARFACKPLGSCVENPAGGMPCANCKAAAALASVKEGQS
jgi:hypothetical protein